MGRYVHTGWCPDHRNCRSLYPRGITQYNVKRASFLVKSIRIPEDEVNGALSPVSEEGWTMVDQQGFLPIDFVHTLEGHLLIEYSGLPISKIEENEARKAKKGPPPSD